MGTEPLRVPSGSLARESDVDTPLLELLRCPFCRASLAEAEGSLACTGCGRTFGRSPDGIPLMLHEDLPGARAKLGEMAGWVEKAREEGWYEPDDKVDAVRGMDIVIVTSAQTDEEALAFLEEMGMPLRKEGSAA